MLRPLAVRQIAGPLPRIAVGHINSHSIRLVLLIDVKSEPGALAASHPVAPLSEIVAVLFIDGKPCAVGFPFAVHITLVIVIPASFKPFGEFHITFQMSQIPDGILVVVRKKGIGFL